MNAILSRSLAAIFGGYILSTLVAILVSYLFFLLNPEQQANGVLFAMLTGFLVYAGIALWVFAQRSAKKVWSTILLVALVTSAFILALAVYTKPAAFF